MKSVFSNLLSLKLYTQEQFPSRMLPYKFRNRFFGNISEQLSQFFFFSFFFDMLLQDTTSTGADTEFQRGQSNCFNVTPCSCLDIKMQHRYHLCCVINFNTLVGFSSVQDRLKTTSQWKSSTPYILTYYQFCKASTNWQLVYSL